METRSKVFLMWKNGYPVTIIQKRLSQEGVTVSKVSLFAPIKTFIITNVVVDLRIKHRSSKLSICHYRYIDEVMTAGNEVTSSLFCATIQTFKSPLAPSSDSIWDGCQRRQGTVYLSEMSTRRKGYSGVRRG